MDKCVNPRALKLQSVSWWLVNVFVIVCCTTSITETYQINLSFDSLFPTTWYQKGLDSSLSVWQDLVNMAGESKSADVLSGDFLLGRLAFAQFCINRMDQEDARCVTDDSTYFSMVLDKIKQLIAMVALTPQTHDFVLCAEDIIHAIQYKLNGAQ